MSLFRKLFFKDPAQTLNEALGRTYPTVVHGVKFELRKLSPIDYLAGARSIHMHFDTYKSKGQQEQLDTVGTGQEKIKEHYRHIFMSAVISPKLKWKDEADKEGIFVDNLFTDWDLATELYLAIMQVSYGKKKLMSLLSQKTG